MKFSLSILAFLFLCGSCEAPTEPKKKASPKLTEEQLENYEKLFELKPEKL
jgi:hypothetical protein